MTKRERAASESKNSEMETGHVCESEGRTESRGRDRRHRDDPPARAKRKATNGALVVARATSRHSPVHLHHLHHTPNLDMHCTLETGRPRSYPSYHGSCTDVCVHLDVRPSVSVSVGQSVRLSVSPSAMAAQARRASQGRTTSKTTDASRATRHEVSYFTGYH